MRNEGMLLVDLNCQCDAESGVDFFHFGNRKMAYIIGKYAFGKTNQIVTENSAVMFKPFTDANSDLGREAEVARINGGANNTYIFWYESTSSASAFSSSAYFLKSFLSLSADISGEFTEDRAGVKASITGPMGTSRGTSRAMWRSAGTSMVCVMVMV